MMILSDVEIEERIRKGSIRLIPFDATCLNGAGYDLRLLSEVGVPPGQYRLVATLERVELGADVAATLHIRSSLARVGIIASLALVDPGFQGQLTVSLYNAGDDQLEMRKGDRFLQMVFHHLGMKASRTYSGRYQNSQGIVHRRA